MGLKELIRMLKRVLRNKRESFAVQNEEKVNSVQVENLKKESEEKDDNIKVSTLEYQRQNIWSSYIDVVSTIDSNESDSSLDISSGRSDMREIIKFDIVDNVEEFNGKDGVLEILPQVENRSLLSKSELRVSLQDTNQKQHSKNEKKIVELPEKIQKAQQINKLMVIFEQRLFLSKFVVTLKQRSLFLSEQSEETEKTQQISDLMVIFERRLLLSRLLVALKQRLFLESEQFCKEDAIIDTSTKAEMMINSEDERQIREAKIKVESADFKALDEMKKSQQINKLVVIFEQRLLLSRLQVALKQRLLLESEQFCKEDTIINMPTQVEDIYSSNKDELMVNSEDERSTRKDKIKAESIDFKTSDEVKKTQQINKLLMILKQRLYFIYEQSHKENDVTSQMPMQEEMVKVSSPNRSELRVNFEDKRQVQKDKIKKDNRILLHHSSGDSPQARLKNKIVDQVMDVSLLCEIYIDDTEYEILCKYVREKYESLVEKRQKPTVDIMFTVGMIQIGIRTYDNTFWSHVAEAIGITSIPISRHMLFGECVMQTLSRLGKVVCEGEYVTTILLHGFIVDSYAYRVFNYLFQYYNIDLKRDISDLRDNDLEYLCASIINPYAKRQQLLSNYMGISIRAEKDFTKKVLLSILKLIDQSFWNEYTENISLPGRLDVFFKKWKEQSSFYKEEKEKNDNNRITNKPHNFRTPQLHCDMNNAEFMIILPEQLIRNELIENGECFYWKISHNGNSRTLHCTIREGFSGYSTREEIINIEPSEQFSDYHFSFLKGEDVVREFVWKARKANFFNHDGIWVNSQRIKPGELFAYSNIECTITSRGLLCSRVRNGLMFYEFEFLNGDVISVEAEANYYVGQIPSDGISSEGHVAGAKLVYGDGEYDVYNNAPSIIFSAEVEQLNGIALIVNGIVSHFIKNSFIDLQIENSKSKYYVLNTENITGITEGINKIVIDFPATSKKVVVNFAYIKGLSYEFEDEPYVFQTKGTLKVNLLQKSKFKLIDERGGNEKNFEIGQLLDTKVSRKIQNGAEQYDIMFDVPVFEYSTDERNWSIMHPQDVWHNDLPAVYYIKCSVGKIGLCVKSSAGDKKILYTKNSNGIFVCDITKLKTYLYNERFIEKIYVLIGKKEYDFVRILMKSYFVNAILEADIENKQLIAKFNILGKNVYYVDFKCNSEILLEKEPISDGQIVASIPIISSTEYTLTVFEQEDEFAFDEEYTYVGSKKVSIFNPNDLIGCRFKLQNIVLVKDGSMYETASTYYGYINEKIDSHQYKGLLVEVFHESNITKAAEVIIHISDLNQVNQVVIKFLDEYEEEMEYEYDNYSCRIVEEEQKKISKSQAYRRYEMLDSDKFIWNILYDETIKDYTVEAREKIQIMKNARKNSLVWKSY